MSLINLVDRNFGVSGDMLMCNVPNINVLFVLFKTENCEYCKSTLPVFAELSRRELRVAWGVMDLGKYRSVIAMSKDTSFPLKSVPMLILFVNGRPHANYKGDRSVEGISKFLNSIIPTLNVQKKFVSSQQQGGVQRGAPSAGATYGPTPGNGIGGGSVGGGGGGEIFKPTFEGGETTWKTLPTAPEAGIAIPARIKPYNEPWKTLVTKQ
jgi:thiol-disulfide isomerase/thioredoxin